MGMGNDTCKIGSFNLVEQDPLLTCPQDSQSGIFDLAPAIVAIVGPALTKQILDASVSFVFSALSNAFYSAGDTAAAFFNSLRPQKLIPTIYLPHKDTESAKFEFLGFTLQENGPDHLPLGWSFVELSQRDFTLYSVYNDEGAQVLSWALFDNKITHVQYHKNWIRPKFSLHWTSETPYALIDSRFQIKGEDPLICGFFPSVAIAKAAITQFKNIDKDSFNIQKFDSSPMHSFSFTLYWNLDN